jgi:vancomycin aglycone glucosyltransferase
MRVLLTTIGSQGDVRPLVALASQLIQAGHGAHLCVSPDLRDWVEGLGFPFTPIGPQMRGMVGAPVTKPAGSAPPPSPEQMRGQVEATLARESATLTEAARGCDVIVAAAGRPLIPARSVAETLGNPLCLRRLLPVTPALAASCAVRGARSGPGPGILGGWQPRVVGPARQATQRPAPDRAEPAPGSRGAIPHR